MVPYLVVDELVLGRNGQALGAPLSFALDAGQALHLVGPNGSGKTTLLDTLTTLARPEAGEVRWQGQTAAAWGDELRALWHYCGHVDALKGEWSLLANLRWQARLWGQPLPEALLQQALAEMALTPLAEVALAQLSKGQQRRAALLRLRLFQRPVWLLDEPFNALDEGGARMLVSWLERHLGQGGMVLFTTHQAYPALAQAPQRLSLGGQS